MCKQWSEVIAKTGKGCHRGAMILSIKTLDIVADLRHITQHECYTECHFLTATMSVVMASVGALHGQASSIAFNVLKTKFNELVYLGPIASSPLLTTSEHRWQ